MSEKELSDKEIDKYRQEMVMDALIRVTSLENLLMEKNIVSEQELSDEIKIVSDDMMTAYQDNLALSVLIRITALENLLIARKIVSDNDLFSQINSVSLEVSKTIDKTLLDEEWMMPLVNTKISKDNN